MAVLKIITGVDNKILRAKSMPVKKTDRTVKKLVAAVLKRAPLDGWVCGKGGHDGRILRIAPPINITEQVINDLVEAIGETFKSEEVEAA